MNPHIFREYDIRGIAEEDLTDQVAYGIGRAFGTLVRRDGGRQVVLGHDVRDSSPRLHRAVGEGLADCGIQVLDLGFVVTPGGYFAAAHFEADGSLQVTGSHNPADYNGFKRTLGGAAVYGDQIQEIRGIIAEEDYEEGEGSITSRPVDDAYFAAITGRVTLKDPPRIAIDTGNGTAGPMARRVLEALGCEVDCLYCEPDGSFPNHLADPTVPEYMDDLVTRVEETGAEMGIGFDGDGDRIGVVDSGGRMVYGDQLLAIFARDVLERLGDVEIIFDVKCSQALVEDIRAHGGTPHMWKTGHSLIKAEMKRTGAPIAGEMSGHMFFKEDWYGFDDALYAAARLLGILDRWGKALKEVVDDIPSYHSTPEIRVDCPDDAKFEVVAEVTRRFKERDDVEVVDIDGARVVYPDGWGLVRSSNTQPVIVLRFEGKSQQALDRVRQDVLGVLEDFPAVDLSEVSS